jgi:quinol-cytochrome oxidoreductase complex cytochrome b subunit
MASRATHALRSHRGYSNHVAEFSKFEHIASKIKDVRKLKAVSKPKTPILEKLSINNLNGASSRQKKERPMKRKLVLITMLICIVLSLIDIKERNIGSISIVTSAWIMGAIYLVFFGCLFALFVIDSNEPNKEDQSGV